MGSALPESEGGDWVLWAFDAGFVDRGDKLLAKEQLRCRGRWRGWRAGSGWSGVLWWLMSGLWLVGWAWWWGLRAGGSAVVPGGFRRVMFVVDVGRGMSAGAPPFFFFLKRVVYWSNHFVIFGMVGWLW